MDSYSEEFIAWMDRHGLKPKSLAPLIGKKGGTIANWRCNGVPERDGVRDHLTAFMRDYRPIGSISQENQLLIPFTEEQYALVEKAGSLTELGTKEFVRMAATERAQDEIAKRSHLKVADDGKDSLPKTKQLPVKYPAGKRTGAK